MTFPLGAIPTMGGVRFAVWSGTARKLWVSLFDADGNRETGRIELAPQGDGMFAALVPSLPAGARYGLRADGPFDPARGLWFDPDKLLVDPYALEIDRPYVYDARLAAKRGEGGDTASLMPKAIAADTRLVSAAPRAPVFQPGGLIYEIHVRAFTMLHPDVPEADRGTIRALAHPAIIAHLTKIGVSAVELMPVTAKMDERHLGPLGLTNAWGYNPVTFMALDPRLAPRGIADLRDTVAALRAAGIGVILDLVFNHTAESDELGPTLSLRGLDSQAYYRHRRGGSLVNDTGTGNTLACDHPVVRQLVLDSLRHFVANAGVDGFRFDLAPVLGRVKGRFRADAPLLQAMRTDPLLKDRVMIAEPWDLGEEGYRLGGFSSPFLEWNDRYRDDMRRFWRGDRGTVGALATRLAGSSDIFAGRGQSVTRTVNFIAAHDGMSLADIVRFERKHNEANGEDNRDGHNENLSWNSGVEGDTANARVIAQRAGDIRAMLSTLFASRGTIMLTAGDEFGRTQGGNNNAYAQDNAVTWLDWANRDLDLEKHVSVLAALRCAAPALRGIRFLTGEPGDGADIADVAWLTEAGTPFDEAAWHEPERRRIVMVLRDGDPAGGRLAVIVNGDRRATMFVLPQRGGYLWRPAIEGQPAEAGISKPVPGRSVIFLIEHKAATA